MWNSGLWMKACIRGQYLKGICIFFSVYFYIIKNCRTKKNIHHGDHYLFVLKVEHLHLPHDRYPNYLCHCSCDQISFQDSVRQLHYDCDWHIAFIDNYLAGNHNFDGLHYSRLFDVRYKGNSRLVGWRTDSHGSPNAADFYGYRVLATWLRSGNNDEQGHSETSQSEKIPKGRQQCKLIRYHSFEYAKMLTLATLILLKL